MPEMRRGVAYGIAAYGIWGLFPLYFPLLKPAGAVEILAHRMVWSLVLMLAILMVARNWSWIRRLTPRRLGLLALAALVIAGNWGTYIYAVNSGLTIETLVLFVPALVYLGMLEAGDAGTFGHAGAGQAALLAGAGLITAVPLLLFNGAAIRVPLTALGMMQYIAPVLQFVIGLFIQHEEMPASRWIGFLLVWIGLVILTVDGLRARAGGDHPAAPPRRTGSPPQPGRETT